MIVLYADAIAILGRLFVDLGVACRALGLSLIKHADDCTAHRWTD